MPLQPQLPRVILPEQTALADIAPRRLHRPTARLTHNRPLGCPCNRGTGRMSGPVANLLWSDVHLEPAIGARLGYIQIRDGKIQVCKAEPYHDIACQ